MLWDKSIISYTKATFIVEAPEFSPTPKNTTKNKRKPKKTKKQKKTKKTKKNKKTKKTKKNIVSQTINGFWTYVYKTKHSLLAYGFFGFFGFFGCFGFFVFFVFFCFLWFSLFFVVFLGVVAFVYEIIDLSHNIMTWMNGSWFLRPPQVHEYWQDQPVNPGSRSRPLCF